MITLPPELLSITISHLDPDDRINHQTLNHDFNKIIKKVNERQIDKWDKANFSIPSEFLDTSPSVKVKLAYDKVIAKILDDPDVQEIKSRIEDLSKIYQMDHSEDKNLLRFFKVLRQSCENEIIIIENQGTLEEFIFPDFKGTVSEKAEQIRAWMDKNESFLRGFTNLNLSNANLKTVPPEINKFSQLGKLCLDGNPITSWPENINLPNLTVLHLQDTLLASFPDSPNLPRLEELNLAHTKIKELPQRLYLDLLGLDLSNNKIETLSETFGLQLVWLNISNTEIIALPSSFSRETLTIESNVPIFFLV